jgi:hypothetical protein|nr:MAG TPA: PGDYG protein [Caudoviricetes sp.]
MGPSDVQVRLIKPRPRIFEAVKQWATKDCFVESYLEFREGCWVVKRSSGSVEILEPDDFHAHYENIL